MNKKMKMVWHETITDNITIGYNELSYFPEKIQIIISAKEDFLAVISRIVKMI
jgi:hypothetical protein